MKESIRNEECIKEESKLLLQLRRYVREIIRQIIVLTNYKFN